MLEIIFLWEAMHDILVCWQQQGVLSQPESQYNDYRGHIKTFWGYGDYKG